MGRGEVLTCSDYGIPQFRRRLITLFTRDPSGKQYFQANGGTFFPLSERTSPPSLRDAIGHLPALDGSKDKNTCPSFHPMHTVGCMTSEKYWWVSNTPEGDTAYNNQCVDPKCRFQGNRRHIDTLADGRWQSSKETPIYCERCGALLPRPTILDPTTGERRLIRGFHSAYRRMEWDRPAHALTRNFPFEASDNKIHPEQHRVLSVYEALTIQTVTDYDYHWTVDRVPVTRSLIAQAIGESVPPKLIDFITKKIICISEGAPLEARGQFCLF